MTLREVSGMKRRSINNNSKSEILIVKFDCIEKFASNTYENGIKWKHFGSVGINISCPNLTLTNPHGLDFRENTAVRGIYLQHLALESLSSMNIKLLNWWKFIRAKGSPSILAAIFCFICKDGCTWWRNISSYFAFNIFCFFLDFFSFLLNLFHSTRPPIP